MKNIAIVGCGNMGGGHALAIGYGTGYTDWQLPQIIDDEVEAVTTDISKILHLSGIYDIDEKRQNWARGEGFHVYQSLEEILADPEVDIVLIAVPNHLHAEIAIKAMRAGKHVLCEKPVTPTSAELEEVLKVSKETGMVFYPRQNRRWDPDYLLIKKIYDEQLLSLIHISILSMALRPVMGRILDTKGISCLLIPAFLGCGICLVFVGVGQAIFVFLIAGVFGAIGQGSGLPSIQAHCVKMTDKASTGMATSTIMTVSYTHLDVYKRQAYLRGNCTDG